MSVLLQLNKTHIGVALGMAGAIGLVVLRRARRTQTAPENEHVPERPSALTPHYTLVAYILAFVSIPAWIVFGAADWPFFIVIAISGGMLGLACIEGQNGRRALHTLGGILLLNIVLLTRALLISYGPFGVDSWFHVSVIRDIVRDGYIGPSASTYQGFPLFHVLGAEIAQVLSVDPYLVLVVIAFLLSATPVFVFLIGRRFLPTEGALLGALLFSTGDYFLFWQVSTTPMGLGILIFVLLTYLLAKFSRPTLASRVLVALVLVPLVLVHPLVTIYGIVLMVLYFIVSRLTAILSVARWQRDMGTMTLLLTVMTIGWWLYVSTPSGPTFLDRVTSVVELVVNSFSVGNVQIVTRAKDLAYTFILLRDSGLSLLIFLFPIGVVIGSLRAETGPANFLLLAAGSSLFLLLPFGLGIGGTAILLPERMFVIGYVFASICAVWAFFRLRRESAMVRRVATMVLATGFVLVMISSPLGSAIRIPYAHPPQPRQYYTASEIAAGAFFMGAEPGTAVATDGLYARQVLGLWYQVPNRLTVLTPSNWPQELMTPNGMILVRSATQTDPVLVAVGPTLAYYDFMPDSFFQSTFSSPGVSKVYDSGGAWIFTTA